ncbi:MAG TPA: ABC transporter permease [Thermoanaerobaculia bacterium]|nr:ABC transporter permease [Thermoanaerobaculia bacterium]
MSTLVQDFRYAVRGLMKSPGFTVAAVLTLALGIGSIGAFLSILDSVLFRPYAYKEPDRLAVVRLLNPQVGPEDFGLSYPDFERFREASRSFESLSAVLNQRFSITGTEVPLRAVGVRCSANLFATIGTRMVAGRPFFEEEDRPGAPKVAILSERLWRRQFASDPGIVGRTIRIGGVPTTVVGVVDAKTQLPAPNDAEIFVPLATSAASESYHFLRYFVIGRLAPGVSVKQASVEAGEVMARLKADLPDVREGYDSLVISLRESRTGDDRPVLLLGLALTLFVLLIACANVANLLLQRGLERQRVLAVRSALGATRPRLIRQILTESVVLALVGAALGLLIASWLLAATVWLLPPDDLPPYFNNFRLDARSISVLLAVSVGSVLIFGLVPALRSSRLNVSSWLAESGGKATTSGSRQGMRSSLVVAEVALSLILLVVAGLLIQSFQVQLAIDPGFNRARCLATELPLPDLKYGDPAQRGQVYKEIVSRVAELPGVASAAASSNLPIGGWTGTSVLLEGAGTDVRKRPPLVAMQITHGPYFQTIEQRLVAGRLFSQQDTQDSVRVVVLNERAAKALFPDQDPIGRQMRLSEFGNDKQFTVIGVVANIRRRGLNDNRSQDLYLLAEQVGWRDMQLLVRSAADPQGIVNSLRTEVRNVDPDLVVEPRIFDEVLRDLLSTQKVASGLSTIFAVFALFIAAVGLYGAIAYAVSRRSQEIAIRMALGAEQNGILRMVIRQMLKITGLGIGIGLVGAILLSRLMSNLLFGFGIREIGAFVVGMLVIGLVSLVASYLPARQASLRDPLVSLRAG